MINNILGIRKEFKSLFEHSLDFLFVYDLNGNILDINEVVLKNLAYSKEQILNMSIFDLLVEEEKSQAIKALKEIKATGKFAKYNIFKIKKKKSGGFIFLEVSGIPLKNQDEIYAFLGIGHDITTLKKTQQTLIESEEKYRSLMGGLNQVGIGIDIVSNDYKILFQNETLRKKFGNITGELCYEKYMGLENPCNFCPMTEAIKNNKVESIELTATDGRIYELISAPFPNPDGTINKAAEIVIDRTEHILAEERLKDSEKKFRLLFSQSPFSISLYDMKGNLIESNKKFVKKLTEYTNIDFTGQNFIDIASNFQNSKQIIQLFSERLKSIRRGKLLEPIEFFVLTMSGKKIWLCWQSSTVKIENETFNLVIIQDITEKKEAEQKIIESEEKYRNLFDESPIGIMIFDMEGNLIDRNSTLTKKIPENIGIDFIGKDFKEILISFKDTDQLTKIFIERLRALRKGQSLKPFEFPLYTITGRKVWFNWQSSLVKVNNETFIQVLIQDITDKKETEQKIIDSEKKFRVLFNNSTSGIAYHKIVYDSEGNPVDYVITDVNPLYEKILPFKKEDVINKKATVAYQVESAPFIDIYAKVADTQEPITFETYFPPTDMHFKISVISLKKGEFITVFDDIADRKIAELKLKESEEKFRTIAEQSFMGITIIQDDLIKYANQAMLDIFGYSIDEVKSWKLLEYLKLFPPEVKEFMSRQERRGQEEYDSSQHNYQVRFIKKSGDIGWLDLFSSAIQYKGRPAGMVSIIDITDRLQAENKIRESEEKFRTIAEQSFMGITIMQDDAIKYANQAMVDIFGYSLDEAKSWQPLGYLKLFPPEYREVIMKHDRYRQESYDVTVHNYQVRFIKKSGDIGWLNLFSSGIQYKGRPATMISIIDITEKLQAENKIRESEEKFRNITEQSVIGILIITGEDWDIKYSNQKFADIIGYKREEIEDWKLENFFKLVHPEDVEDLIKLARRKYEGGLEIVKNYQFRVFKKTGEIIWIEIDSKTIPYKDGLADLTSVIDITEKKEAEKLIIEENTKLLELHEMRKDIINRVSHELKTPLTSIYGASEILMAKCKDEMSDNVLSFMEILYRGAIRLKELVDNLLDGSLLDSKNFKLKLKKEDIIEIITGVVDEMTHLADLRQLRLNTDLPDNLFLDVDKLRLRQAFNNIISNAIKNTPTGGQIFINLIGTSNFVDIKIKDTGVGITEKEKEKLFEKFGKIERYGMNLDVDIEGSGLGLYISKEIVELHGGQILVESEGRHKGSTFTIRLFRNR